MRNGRTQFRLTAWWLLVSSSHKVWGRSRFYLLMLGTVCSRGSKGSFRCFLSRIPILNVCNEHTRVLSILLANMKMKWKWKFFEFQHWSLHRHSMVIVQVVSSDLAASSTWSTWSTTDHGGKTTYIGTTKWSRKPVKFLYASSSKLTTIYTLWGNIKPN